MLIQSTLRPPVRTHRPSTRVTPTAPSPVDRVEVSGFAPIEQPTTDTLTRWGGLSCSVAGAVVGGVTRGPVGMVTGAVVGLAGGALTGHLIGRACYSLSQPTPEPVVVNRYGISKAQAKVNDALERSGESKPTRAIAHLARAALSDTSPQTLKENMVKKYRTLRLLDDKMEWIPALKPHADKLLPVRLDAAEMNRFIDRMAESAEANPYLMKFLNSADKDTVPRLAKCVADNGAVVLSDALILAQVLERLTGVMSEDPHAYQECREHWKSQVDSDPEFWRTQDPFRYVKTLSVNWGLDEVNEAYKKGELDPHHWGFILPLNILEASVADYHQAHFGMPGAGEGHLGNCKTGLILAGHGPQGAGDSAFSDDGKLVEIHPKATERWDNLYATWNMSFITVSPLWPQVMTKLLIPSVSDYKAEPETYIHRRALALQTYLYYTGLSDVDGTSPKTDWRDPALTNAWGKANLESARDYEKRARIK